MQTDAKTYLVTGGAGFIGSHVVEALIKAGNRVKVVDNFSTGKRNNLDGVRDRVELLEFSITDRDKLNEAMQGVDYVFHIAALASVPRSVDDPIGSNDNNVTGTLNVLLAARDAGVKRVVYSGSSSAYGDSDVEYKTEDLLPRPLSPYAVAKLAAEHYCQAFSNVYGLETVTVRYFNVFGPRQDPLSTYAAVIPKFITLMLKGESPRIEGDGLQSRDFTYIDNVVHGNLLACHTPGVSGETFNIAVGGNINLLNMVSELNRLMGTQIEPEFVAPRPGDVKHSRAAIDKAGRMLGYEPVVSFEDGLARTLAWYKTAMPV
ncbi:MAG TPA: SDR family oxidoreductase [Aggregatilinea sp.]|jgi:UDP-glucose 4-epimerase|uniref:SDR family oxidoreductase n=1 Tax=Aggregatilinea sp. TaxID=2806333 RepID=UPI002CFCA8A2|nr:SDR family oxidoreductase [Aggregatilinea sp.]HML20391.1 SDR family oxidoreductase [Aggregatilinea sp.]